MEQRFETEELDPATRSYLREVAQRRGRGAPGVYLDAQAAGLAPQAWLITGTVLGPLVVLLAFLIARNTLASPRNTAMLLTAGLLLGGWLTFAWLRYRLVRRRDDFLGHFKYVDPLYLWHATGQGVEVTSLALLTGADRQEKQIGAFFPKTIVSIELADGRIDLSVANARAARALHHYLNALVDTATGPAGERGHAALQRVNPEDLLEEPTKEDPPIMDVPQPKRARRSYGWVRLVVLLLLTVGLFFACRWLAVRWRDDTLFEAYRHKKLPEIRAYLLDPRNTRHRDEMLERLAKIHDEAATRLAEQQDANNAELVVAMQEIIRGFRHDPRPEVTVWFKPGKGADRAERYVSEAVLGTMQREMIRTIAETLGNRSTNNHFGGNADLLDFSQKSDGPAMIEVECNLRRVAEKNGRVWMEWTVTIQPTPDAEKKTVTLLSAEQDSGKDQAATMRGLYNEFAPAFLRGLGMTQ